MSSEKWVDLSHGRTRSLEAGAGPPVLFRHGVGFAAPGDGWTPVLERLDGRSGRSLPMSPAGASTTAATSGTRSRIWSTSSAGRVLHDGFAGARLQAFEGIEHGVPWECPGGLTALLQEFLA